jgi:hypothetical protein
MRFCIILIVAMLITSTIAMADLTTDKTTYKPGDTVTVTLSYPQKLGDFRISVTGPNNTNAMKASTMKNVSSNVWTYSFALGLKLVNGKYDININASQVGAIVNPNATILKFKQSFSVSAWSVDASLDKYYLIQGDKLNMTVIIKDRFSDKINFNIRYWIVDANGNTMKVSNFTLPGASKGFGDVYDITENYALGVSNIFINVTDSDKRSRSSRIDFSVYKPISFEPKKIEQSMKNEIIQTSVKFTNKMDSDISVDDVQISPDLSGIVSIVQRPYVIARGGTGTMEIRINSENLQQNVYSGYIRVMAKGVKNDIPLAINVVVPVEEVDNSYIIWSFAIGITVSIVIITIVRYKTMKKRPKPPKQEQKKKVVYVQPQGDYRADYY